ncbi:MAG TPA: hypothetical protein VGK58_20730, partial [Lacipirellulaceae bacterium]
QRRDLGNNDQVSAPNDKEPSLDASPEPSATEELMSAAGMGFASAGNAPHHRRRRLSLAASKVRITG